MKKFISAKRFISALLCTVLIFAFLPSFGFAENGESLEFEKNVSLLNLAGVVSQTSFSDAELLANVSRADFLFYVSKLLKIEEQPNVEEEYFTDLDGHWAGKLVSQFVKMGVISAGGDRIFRPEDAVTRDEAAKIITSVLGYDALARVNGGYPSGYLLIMSRLGIFPNGTGENITFAEVIYALANALEAPCYEIKSLEGGTVYYEQDDENTLLKVYHGIKSDEGYVTSFGNMSLDGISAEGDIMYIGGEKYNAESISGADGFLGKYVDVYYSESGKQRTALLLCVSENDSSFEIDASDIDTLDSDYRLNYYKDGADKTSSKKLARSIRVLYNGALKQDGIRDMFANLKNGTVRLVDADENGTYEYAVVNDYSDFIAGYADAEKSIIYDKSGKTEYELEKFDRYAVLDVSGAKTGISGIKENTVLSVAVSEDKTSYIEIIVSNAVVSGNADEILTSGNDTYITVGGSEYKISAECAEKDAVYAGYKGAFYLNAFGEIAYIKADMSSDFRYGYITHGEIAEDTHPKAVQIELFDDTGALKMRKIEDNIVMDGEKIKKAEDVLTLEWAKNKVIQPQMIRYKTDADGKITHIDTVYKNGEYENGKDALLETIPVDDSLASSDVQRIFSCTASSRRIGTNVVFTNSTKLFFVPKYDDIKNENYESSDFSIGAFADMVIDSGVNAAGYRADETAVYEDAVVCYGKGTGEEHDDNTNVFVLKNIKKASDAEGFIGTKIYGLRGGSEVSLFIADSYVSQFEALGLAEGDLLSLRTDNQGKVSDIIVLYDFSQGGEPFAQTGSKWYDKNRFNNNYTTFSQKFAMSFMYAGYKSGNLIKGIYDISQDAYDSSEAFDVSAVKIIVVDSERTKGNKVYAGSAADIKCAAAVGNENSSKIFVHYRYLNVKDVVVYK